MTIAAGTPNAPGGHARIGARPARQAVQARTRAQRTLTISLLARTAAGSLDNPIIRDATAGDLAIGLGLTAGALGRCFAAAETGTAVSAEPLDQAATRFAGDRPARRVTKVS